MSRHDPYSEYLLTFTSFYKSMYAKDQLRSGGINAIPQRVPAGVYKTCSQGLRVTDCDISQVLRILSRFKSEPKHVYRIYENNGQHEYRRIEK